MSHSSLRIGGPVASRAPARRGPEMRRAVSGLDRVRLRLDRIRAAVGEIDPVFLDTPALPCAPLGRALGCSVTLKVETLNPVRASSMSSVPKGAQ
jgi:hypothetical protein